MNVFCVHYIIIVLNFIIYRSIYKLINMLIFNRLPISDSDSDSFNIYINVTYIYATIEHLLVLLFCLVRILLYCKTIFHTLISLLCFAMLYLFPFPNTMRQIFSKQLDSFEYVYLFSWFFWSYLLIIRGVDNSLTLHNNLLFQHQLHYRRMSFANLASHVSQSRGY